MKRLLKVLFGIFIALCILLFVASSPDTNMTEMKAKLLEQLEHKSSPYIELRFQSEGDILEIVRLVKLAIEVR